MTDAAREFRDSNYDPVPYDGSEIVWRPSIYGLCIVNQAVLLIKNREEKFWDIPGGGIEFDESLPEALLREAKEEAGWFLEPVRPLFSLSDWFYHRDEKRFFKTLQLYYLASGKQVLEKPLDSRIEEVRQVNLSELEKYSVYPNVLHAIEIWRDR